MKDLHIPILCFVYMYYMVHCGVICINVQVVYMYILTRLPFIEDTGRM